MKWTAERIPDQSGRVAVVTAANSGLGLVTARDETVARRLWEVSEQMTGVRFELSGVTA